MRNAAFLAQQENLAREEALAHFNLDLLHRVLDCIERVDAREAPKNRRVEPELRKLVS